jgi:hypothetical protein
MGVVVPGTIGKNGRIKQFSAAGTLPGIERADKIVKFFCEHTTLATWTMHSFLPRLLNIMKTVGVITSTMPIS